MQVYISILSCWNFSNKRKVAGWQEILQQDEMPSTKHWVSKYKSASDYKEKFGASFFAHPRH